LTFTENSDFQVKQYRELGFTHFEAWAQGAAGGRGGDSSREMVYVTEIQMRPVAQDVWNLYRELKLLEDYEGQAYDHLHGDYRYDVPLQLGLTYHWADMSVSDWRQGPNGAWYDHRWIALRFWDVLYELGIIAANTMPDWAKGLVGDYLGLLEYANPNHLLPFRVLKQVLLSPHAEGMGGGGGGGGLHKTVGRLDELADTVPIVVGKAGGDAPYGQVIRLGYYTPTPTDTNEPWMAEPAIRVWSGSPTGYRARIDEIRTWFGVYLNDFPNPRATFNNPQRGGHGGVSSFSGGICQASGGEGGGPGSEWDGSKFVFKGHGGRGGLGGRSTPGGGGAGASVQGNNGADGIWLPEDGIGGGGGGGKGGIASIETGAAAEWSKRAGYNYPGAQKVIRLELASGGGLGNFSYGDTTVYGQRGVRPSWAYSRPFSERDSGVLTWTPMVDNTHLVIPGVGGGGRPMPNLKFGSYARGYSPHGVVVVRLLTITN